MQPSSCELRAASDTGPTSSVVDEAIHCHGTHTRRRQTTPTTGRGWNPRVNSTRPPPHPIPRWGSRWPQERTDQATAGMRKRAPTHLSVPHCTAPQAHWSSRGWNADIMQPETHSPPFIGRNQARFPKPSRFPGRGNDGGVIQHEPKFPSHAPRVLPESPRVQRLRRLSRDAAPHAGQLRLGGFPSAGSRKTLPLPARQPVRCGILGNLEYAGGISFSTRALRVTSLWWSNLTL